MKKSLLLLLCLVPLAGCTKNAVPDGLPKLVPITLTITQEGVPLSGAVVSLVGDAQFAAGGVTDDNGRAVLSTHGRYKGSPLGKFKVCVVKTDSDPFPEPGTPEFAARKPRQTYTFVERQYTQSETTPLEIDVTGPLTITLDVGKAVKDVL